MTGDLFSLIPFPSDSVRHDLIISGSVERRSNILAISFVLAGPLSEIVIPSAAEIPCRKNALWEETCFELFLGRQNSEEYYEFNFSPAGHWNVYRFTAYRQGMTEEPSFASLPFRVHQYPDALQLSIEIALDKIIKADQLLKIGISAVIKSINGRTTYWALTHPGTRPDFHNKESFIIEL
jgi:hypothetical protein